MSEKAAANSQVHQSIAFWAADCAERALSHFESTLPFDERPRRAIEAACAWARGEIKCGQARAAAVAAHAAARETDDEAARAAARSAGHAAATAHMVGHAKHAAAYAVKAIPSDSADAEHDWQLRHLPENLRAVVFPPTIDR
jgi:hypothetical protein